MIVPKTSVETEKENFKSSLTCKLLRKKKEKSTNRQA